MKKETKGRKKIFGVYIEIHPTRTKYTTDYPFINHAIKFTIIKSREKNNIKGKEIEKRKN